MMMTENRIFTLILTLVCIVSANHISGQTDSLPPRGIVDRCHLFGIGTTNILDTYLSPENYTGIELHSMSESVRTTKYAHNRISRYGMSMGSLAYMDYRDGNGSEIAGMYTYDLGWHYNWLFLNGNLRIQAGGLFDFNLGFIYNTRNSNNPAQAKFRLNIAPSVIAIYKFKISNKPFAVRYSLTTPAFGVMFSPNYGQSYYEIFSEGNYDHNIVFTTFGNSPSLRNVLTVDFNIGKSTIRAGYMGDFQQSDINNLKSHVWSHVFMIGYVKRFKILPAQ